MKRLFFTQLFVITAFFCFAQETEPTDSTEQEDQTYSIGSPDEDEDHENNTVVEFNFGKTDTSKNVTTRWFTLGIGVNPVLNDGNFDLPQDPEYYEDWELRNGKSTNVDLGIVQYKLNMVNHKLNLYTGLGLDINKYMFQDDFRIDMEESDWVTYREELSDVETKKNRLTTTYIHIPLMLNYESDTKHYDSFRINAGGFAGLRLGSNQKIKFKKKDDNPFDNKKKYKENDNFNQSPITYGLKAEIGYGPINIYAKYHLQDIFEDDSDSPELNTLALGLMIIPF